MRLRQRTAMVVSLVLVASTMVVGVLAVNAPSASAAASPSQAWATTLTAGAPTGATGTPVVGETRTWGYPTGVTAVERITALNPLFPASNFCTWDNVGTVPFGVALGQANVLQAYSPTPPTNATTAEEGCGKVASESVSYSYSKAVINPILHVKLSASASITIGGTTTTGAPITLTTVRKAPGLTITGNVINPSPVVDTTPNTGCEAQDGTNGNTECVSVQLNGLISTLSLTLNAPLATNGGAMIFMWSYPTATLTKAFVPTSIPVGGTSALTFSINSPNDEAQSTLTPLDFTDALPTGLAIANTTVSNNGSCGTPTFSNNLGGALAVGSVGVGAANITVAPATTCTITVNVTGSAVGSYTISVTNTGAGAGTATVTDPVPATVTVSTVTCTTSAGSSCTAGPQTNSVAGSVTLLAAGTASYLITGTVNAAGSLTNTATVTATTPGCSTQCGGGTASTQITQNTAVADLSATKTLDQTTITAGAPITYLARMSNAGPSAAVGVVTVDPVSIVIVNPVGTPDPSEAGSTCTTRASTAVDLVSLAPAHGPYTVAGYPKVVECDYPTLAVGQVVVDTITGTIDASLLAGSTVINQVVVFAQTFDPDLANNLAIAVGPASLAAAAIPPSTPSTPNTTTPVVALAFTGVDSELQLILASVTLALGLVFLLAGRRRGRRS
jgi:uncharacterized repeat protein (TIGR01451 family)